MLLASVPPHKRTFLKAVEWLMREIQREGVEIRLNREGTPEIIEKEKPDAVLLATGASPLDRLGCSGPNILTAWEVLAGGEVGKRVLILGGEMVGIETAEFLLAKGCQVTVVTSRERWERLAPDMEGTTRALLLERLPTSGISLRFAAKVVKVGDGKVLVNQGGKEDGLEAETIVLAQGSRPNQDLLRALEGKVPQLIPIGDCLEPRMAKEAILEGFLAALRI